MKILVPILALVVSLACHSSVLKNEPVSSKPNPTVSNHNVSNSPSTPNDASKVEQTKQSELETQNERFKIVPEDFKQIDFKNFSYPYKFSYGRKINIALKNGEYEYDIANDRGWFSLSDAYYVDLTDDGSPEAIVILWHVSCGASCDGGAGLFYIYTAHQNKLKSLWQYETGSLAYGCGLKSFTVKNRKMTMELFGRCFDETEESLGGKFQVRDTTRLIFGFNGRKFVEEEKEIISAPERSVLNYQPEISINE
jgi:hypothetical protein